VIADITPPQIIASAIPALKILKLSTYGVRTLSQAVAFQSSGLAPWRNLKLPRSQLSLAE